MVKNDGFAPLIAAIANSAWCTNMLKAATIRVEIATEKFQSGEITQQELGLIKSKAREDAKIARRIFESR